MENNVSQSVQEEQFSPEVEITKEEQPLEVFANDQYSNKTREELLAELQSELESKSVEELKSITENIKSAFYKRGKVDFEAAKKDFVTEGGDPEQFKMESDSLETQLKEMLSDYRNRRSEANSIIEKERANNFAEKLSIIQKLKELVERSENSNENTYPDFLEIQQQWKSIGAIAKENLNDTWNAYHFQVESYYSFMKINNELRDLDLKRNLEQKIAICEESEKLALLPSFVEAFKQLQTLHDKWREIGPVPRVNKDEIWDRFKAASTIINKNHQQYFEQLNAEQDNNLKIKKELCEKVEAIIAAPVENRKDWDAKTEEVVNIQSVWRTIGFAPKKDNTKIYEEFKELCNKFFESKHDYFKSRREQVEGIIGAKLEICRTAQTLKESSEWTKTTNELIALQKRWKELSGVSSKELDQAWKDFREACDHFFNRKSEHFKQIEESYRDRIAAKESIITMLQSFEEENPHTAIEKLKDIQRQWSESGFVPSKIQNPLYEKYKEIIDAQFTKFKKGTSQLSMDNFKNKLSNNSSKFDISRERDRLHKKLQKLETDIQTLENNIGFFSKSSNADSLIKEIKQKIENSREEVRATKEKIKHIINEEKSRNE